MSKITFTVPLGQGTQWENNELRYMLRSLEAHCQFDFDVKLYTTRKVDWFNGEQQIVKRTYPEKVKNHFDGKLHYENYYDVIHKLQAILEDNSIPEEFMFIYDDMILLEDYYIVDTKKIHAGVHYDHKKQRFDNPKGNKWMQTIHSAFQICKAFGYGMYTYETHLPRYFRKTMLKEMFKKHVPEESIIPYALSTVYYNMIQSTPESCLYAKNIIKTGFYGGTDGNDGFNSQTKQEINEAIKDKLWVNYSNKGLTPALKDWIQESFPKPSKFER